MLTVSRVVIRNFKSLREFDLCLNEGLNIIVGDNESGKSTLLEAINLALTGIFNGRNINYELTPYLFNQEVVKQYVEMIRNGEPHRPPSILIELYLKDIDEFANLLGRNNSLGKNEPGVKLSIEYDESYANEYREYIKMADKVNTIPIEYYKVNWLSFSNQYITRRSMPFRAALLDTSGQRRTGPDRYLSEIIDAVLDDQKKVDLSLEFRKMKEEFSQKASIQDINSYLSARAGEITDKELSVSVDVSAKTSWERTLTSYLDEIPFSYVGKGEESSVKIKLALELYAAEASVIMLEEPENHLSYSNMNKLIETINTKCIGKQLILTTHSSFVLNKLGIDNVIVLANGKHMKLTQLGDSTKEYFEKLPGYDTLRMVLSKKVILVEGPSDELFVQKAYFTKYGKLPIHDAVDVIAVRGLSFKRFLEIATILDVEVIVITDNDGDYLSNIENKYSDYIGKENVAIVYSRNDDLRTLEDHIVDANSLETLNEVLGKKYETRPELLRYMKNNKTDWALAVFKSGTKITYPEYIYDAI